MSKVKIPPLFIATGNEHKVGELQACFAKAALSIEVFSARAAGGMPEVDENAGSFAGNARLKAEALAERLRARGQQGWVLADDSGLEVDALNGAPGVYSSRYAGPGAKDADNNHKLLEALRDFPPDQRQARFHCCLVLAGPAEGPLCFEGSCEGSILEQASGHHGFGYDPLFQPRGYDQSFASLGAEVKNKISHRAGALRAFLQWISAE